MTTVPVLRLTGLRRHFGAVGSVLHAVDGVDLEIAPGETLGVVGESGCGKSTLARLVLKLLAPSAGRVEIMGHDVTNMSERAFRPLRHNLQAVFQDPMSSLNPRLTVRAIVGEPLDGRRSDRRERAARVREMLRVVGLPNDAADRYPHAFSGGQRQRIAIARALAADPKLVICDEATSALDVSVQAQILALLLELQAQFGISFMFISHNLGAVRQISHRVAVMYLGRIVETGNTEQIFSRPAHPYTAALLEAAPEAELHQKLTAPLAGEVPSSYDRPKGCHFSPRCPRVQSYCREVEPEPLMMDTGQVVRCHYPEIGPGIHPTEAASPARYGAAATPRPWTPAAS